MSELDHNTYYGKISKLGKIFNKLDPKQVREGIEVAQMQCNRNMKNISNVDLQYGNLDMPHMKSKKKEPIEYVVKPEEEQELEM